MLDVTRDGAASDLLRNLAERTVREPEPRGIGRYHYVHTSSSYLRTVRKAGSRAIRGSIEHMERRQWIAPDGSGRLLVTQDSDSVQPTGDYPPGRLVAAFITTTDPVALTTELRQRNPKGSSAVAINTFTEIWNNQVVPPALQRLLLLDLAGYPDLSVESATRGFRQQARRGGGAHRSGTTHPTPSGVRPEDRRTDRCGSDGPRGGQCANPHPCDYQQH